MIPNWSQRAAIPNAISASSIRPCSAPLRFSTPMSRRSRRRARLRGVYYGRGGTPTTFALEDAIAALEGAHGAVLTGSGKTAIAQALMTFLKAGDHLLMVELSLCANSAAVRPGAQPLRGRDHLLRPADRRRHRAPGAPEHQGDLPGIAGLAHLRSPGRARDRQCRPWARCPDDDRQHVGDAPVLQSAGARRGCRHPCRHQVHLRSFRYHDGRRVDRRSAVIPSCAMACRTSAPSSHRTTAIKG